MGEAGGSESGSKGHSCRGLMPRVEKLEPRNVPQRPLKREVKREGVKGETGYGAQMCLVLHNLSVSSLERRTGWYFILVSVIHFLNLPPPQPPSPQALFCSDQP